MVGLERSSGTDPLDRAGLDVWPERSLSIDALRRNGLTVWPGMTIFWIGDLTHQGEVSGHNPDDYPPLQAELTDADNLPEVRALDFMISPPFMAADAQRLTTALITGVDRPRIYYVIYNKHIYRQATGFRPEPYSGADPHINHVHVSGLATDDANGADWKSVLALGEEPEMDVYFRIKSTDLAWNGKVFVSNRVHRRGPIRAPGEIRKAALTGATEVLLTDAMLLSISATETWETFLDAVAGPSAPAGTLALTDAQVREIVRQELDKTKLAGQ